MLTDGEGQYATDSNASAAVTHTVRERLQTETAVAVGNLKCTASVDAGGSCSACSS
jgi:hypothetical protein